MRRLRRRLRSAAVTLASRPRTCHAPRLSPPSPIAPSAQRLSWMHTAARSAASSASASVLAISMATLPSSTARSGVLATPSQWHSIRTMETIDMAPNSAKQASIQPTDIRRAHEAGIVTLDHSDRVGALRRQFLCSAVVQVYVNGDDSVDAEGACRGAESLLAAMQRRGWMP